jgi:mono/diheme cytochrome c family protein
MLLALSGILSMLACEVGPRSGQGLRLPNGDVARGEQAFQRLGCSGCHSIAGEEGNTQATEGAVVVLGGDVGHVETHGELVTSIVNPSHGVPREYPREEVTEEGRSKMTDLNDTMSVKDLIDLTEYLQSKYSFSPYEVYTD